MATARATRRSSPAARTKRPPAASSRGGSRLLPELAAIACLALAVFLLFVFLLGWEGGIVGVGLRGLLSFLVGLIAYATPVLLIYAAVLLVVGPGRRPLPAATAGLIVLCLAFALAAAADSFGVFPGSRPGSLFDSTYMSGHGGVAGEALWAVLHPLLGGLGIDIIVVALTVVGLLLVSGSSIGALARRSRRGMHAAGRAARDSARSLNQTLDERRRLTDANLRTRLAPRSDDQASTKLLSPQRPSAEPAVTQYMPGVSIHQPRFVDGEQDLPELYRAPADAGDRRPEPRPAPSPADEQEETAAQLSLAAVAAERDDGETLAALNQLAVRSWSLPDATLLRRNAETSGGEAPAAIQEVSRRLISTLDSFGVSAQVINTVTGPRVTRYELQLAPGTKVGRVASLKADLAYSLAATDVRVLAPIPGKTAVGVEVPNMRPSFVALGDVYGVFPSGASPLAFWLGKDITGKAVLADLQRMVHLLVAGATGSGKSACINCLLSSILLRATPEQVRMILIDPKKVELSNFDGIPHLLTPVVTDPRKASNALQNVVHEVERRYELMLAAGAAKLRDLNRQRERSGERVLPYILVVIDELADLMMVAPNDVEYAITRIGQIGRAAGVHMVVATQRPSVDVITGLIKANIPWRIAFAVASQIDSRVILDQGGAEALLGEGDMLFGPSGSARMLRVQGAFVESEEMKLLTGHWRAQAKPELREEFLESPVTEGGSEHGEPGDELLPEAVRTVVNTGAASVALLQRRLRVGYARAGRLIDMMEERGIISGFDGSKARNVLIDENQLQRVLADLRGADLEGEGAGDPETESPAQIALDDGPH